MLPRRSKLLLLLPIVLSCGEEELPPETGIDLTIAYDSTMGVDRLVAWGTTDQGTTRIEQQTIDAPYSVDPPGLRIAPLDLVLEDALEGETVVVRVDGRAADGHVVGSGATTVGIEIDRLVAAQVTLGAPITCGDGRASNLEACDDGNAIAGDGCSDVCTIEPGHACQGSPSICGRCGDGTASGGEQCDDGNTEDGDGCSSVCTLEEIGAFIHEVELLETVTTTLAEFVQIPTATLSFTPNSASDRWIVFASGSIGSSEAAMLTSEMRMLVNGVEVDHFGQQTLGAEDNEAGFVTFETITGSAEEQVVTLQFRALAGTTRVQNVRMVAALIPPGSDFQYVEADDVLETAGTGLELLRLDFTPSRAGDYLVLAKGNLTEAPSGSTARLWLEDDDGTMHPPGGFSAPRDALLPAFVAAVKPLDLSPKSFVIRGSSSGTATYGDWWNEAFHSRQVVVVTAPAAGLPAGHPVSVTFDHETQVAAGRSSADGSDVFVVARNADGALRPIDRVLDETSAWASSDTRIWFATVDGAAPEYWIYWGGETVELPPSDPENVFPFFDRFDGAALDPARWSEQSTGVVQDGQLVLGPQSIATAALGRAYGVETIWEAQVTFAATAPPATPLSIWTGALTADDGARASIGFLAQDVGLIAQAGGAQQPIALNDPLVPHLFSFVRRGAQVEFFVDGQPAASLAALMDLADLTPYMANGDQNVAMIYDWVRVRPSLVEEPAVDLGAIESISGALPSRWSYRKLMAFRTDVFARAFHASSPDTVSTSAPEPLVVASLDVDAPVAEADELLIAAARISGESSATARKSGEIRANGELLARTAHRIDRTSERTTGYHHVVGVADARLTSGGAEYRLSILSPDGIRVDAAGAVILVLSYPSRR